MKATRIEFVFDDGSCRRLSGDEAERWAETVSNMGLSQGDGSLLLTFEWEKIARREGRSTWPETWMTIARTIAERSYDPRLKVGAIVVTSDNTQMLSGGYNGNYAGGPHEHESSEPGQSGFIHAEVNALVKLDYNVMKEKHLYITHSPCRMCAKLIINAGIRQVVYGEAYRDPSGLKLLQGVGIRTVSLEKAIELAVIESGRTGPTGTFSVPPENAQR